MTNGNLPTEPNRTFPVEHDPINIHYPEFVEFCKTLDPYEVSEIVNICRKSARYNCPPVISDSKGNHYGFGHMRRRATLGKPKIEL